MKCGRKILLNIVYCMRLYPKMWSNLGNGVSGFKISDMLIKMYKKQILAQHCSCWQVGYQVAWCFTVVFFLAEYVLLCSLP